MGKEPATYVVGVVPQFDARRIQTIWQPILDRLEQATGHKFVLKGSSSIPAFEKQLTEGQFDFAYMNPYHLYVANRQQGYQPLVHDSGKDLYGIVVVSKNSKIKSVAELDGQPVAFPAPNALGASLLTRAAFAKEYGINVLPKYVRTHTSVYLNVALGEVAAGGGVQHTLLQQRPEVQAALKVLYETKHVAAHPLSAHPRVPEALQQQVKQTLLQMNNTPDGKMLLGEIPILEIGPANMDDYAILGHMGLQAFYQQAE
ncbi:MAG: phosphate/phosphite/phosphonate ABC transporter substrate-binding protein [Chromatiales bacterium]